MKTMFICYGTQSPQSTQRKSTAWANRSTLNIMVGGTQTPSVIKGVKISSDQSLPNVSDSQWRTQEFCMGVGVQQIQLRTEDREKGGLGTVAP